MMNQVIMIIAIIFGLSNANKYLLVKINDEVVSYPEHEIANSLRTSGLGLSDRKTSTEQLQKEQTSGESEKKTFSKKGSSRSLKNEASCEERKSEDCPIGFSNRESKKGKTVSKKWKITEEKASSKDECGKKCQQNQYCESFEFNFDEKSCRLNAGYDVDDNLKCGSLFCIRSLCPIGYRPRAGDGLGDIEKTEVGVTIQECANRCNKKKDCKFIAFVEGRFCTSKSSHARKIITGCQKDIETKCTMKRAIGSTTKPVTEYRLCEKMDTIATKKMVGKSRSLGEKPICGGVCNTKGTSGKRCKFPFMYQGVEYTSCAALKGENASSELSCAITVDAENKMVEHAPCKDECKYCDFTICEHDTDCPKMFYCNRVASTQRSFITRAPGGCVPEACRNACPEDNECSKVVCTESKKRCTPFRVEVGGTIYHSCTDIDTGNLNPHQQLWCATTVDKDLVYKDHEWCDTGNVCDAGLNNYISNNTHRYATDNNIEASIIAFGSCIKTDKRASLLLDFGYQETAETFWKHVRASKPDVWLWLGDNAYDDTDTYTEDFFTWDSGTLRMEYNRIREDRSYVKHGLIAQDENGNKIPVMGVWDDHDSGMYDNYNNNNIGNENTCRSQTQDEFVNHFNLPSSNPMHKDYRGIRQVGVYNARMFLKPKSKEPGIHVIMLDARSGRDMTWTRDEHDKCKGIDTQQMSSTQWKWLDKELSKKSEIKIIGSGVQVLPPTDQIVNKMIDYCSLDIYSNSTADSNVCNDTGDPRSFCQSIADVGEDSSWKGTKHESWAFIPQERKRLLQKAQMAINKGMAKAIIFVSGDQHWGEIMEKKMPPIPNVDEKLGKPQMLYEVTSSGIFQQYPYGVPNTNRLDPNAVEMSRGNISNGITGFSNLTTTCSDSPYHTCKSEANYGLITVDFEKKMIRAGLKTPVNGNEEAYIDIPY